MALDLFIGICGALCLIVGSSILLGKLVKWIQERIELRKQEKELGRLVKAQKRWEALEKELEKQFDNNSATDMASDPKPWQPTQQKCPKCGSSSASLHQLNHTAYWRCMHCKEHYELVVEPWPPLRWDRNAVQTSTPAPGSTDLNEN